MNWGEELYNCCGKGWREKKRYARRCHTQGYVGINCALDDPVGFLAERGWNARAVQYGEEGLNFGRWPYPVIPPVVPGMPRFWLVTATRSKG